MLSLTRSEAYHSASYDAANELLDVRLKSGTVYRYFHVPESVYRQLLDSPSPGKFYRANVRHAYSYRRFPGGVITD